MTRLAIVRQKYNPAGGAERFVSRALSALSQDGALEVSLIARRWEKVDGIHALTVDPFYLGNVWRDWGFARAARRAWRREGYDLVQSHERIPGCSIYRAGDGVHAAWLEHRRRALGGFKRLSLAFNPYHRYVCRAERAMFTDAALKLVICNAHLVKREIQRHFGLPDETFAVVYNGVDTDAFHPRLKAEYRSLMRRQWKIPEAAPTLLYVGSGFERKGVERALRAIAPLAGVHLVVVGRDKHAVRYQRLAEALGVASRVRFAGAQNEVKPFYGMADAFVLPTLYDPFPNVCVEALASGLPLFTSDSCGASELVRPGENGWVVDALDVEGLSAAIQVWLAREAQWPALAEAARATAEPLTLSAMARQLTELYRRFL
ncbi:glycosyltransferase family 4 protein [Crenobacter cavernae]|uniref:Glycosyltransferase family 1 protein n=1 Tax=Crenobacter cavernae TaxID=2290923 RepID=A0ABY0FEN7_9NEIS|nr:glycosyltransferase family 4 protein [Crenobacter cavernae]RXZ43731.1 glycosyltransferase family 1 protein [Crenobacter cavernae]